MVNITNKKNLYDMILNVNFIYLFNFHYNNQLFLLMFQVIYFFMEKLKLGEFKLHIIL